MFVRLVALFFTSFISLQIALAQDNYTLVKKDEYEEWYEKPLFVKDARISGEYNLRMFNTRGSDFSTEKDNYWRQDFILRFRSETQSNISFNLAIANQPYTVGEDRGSYFTRVEEERKEGIDSSGDDPNGYVELRVDEAFLEYNHNPAAVLRLGKHYIAPGDREGLVYKGKISAITQQCAVGTWCYYLGGAQLGRNDHDNLYWLNLVYPVFESGNYRSDLWWKEKDQLNHIKERYENALYVEIYRIFYNEFDVALAAYGGNTYRTTGEEIFGSDANVSPFQLKEPGTDKLVYYDMDMEYWGANINWLYGDLELKYQYIRLSGDRHFHTGTQVSGPREKVADNNGGTHNTNNIEGFLNKLEVKSFVTENWKAGFEYFSATGRKASRIQNSDGTFSVDPEREFPWQGTDFGYYEVNRGTYGDANIYFDGFLGTGQGHSVNNVTYYNLNVSYRDDSSILKGFDFYFYQFQRTEPVLNDAVEFVQDIGLEVDIAFTWDIEDNMDVVTDLNWFQVGEAYVENDNFTPPEEQIDDFSTFRLGIHYRF